MMNKNLARVIQNISTPSYIVNTHALKLQLWPFICDWLFIYNNKEGRTFFIRARVAQWVENRARDL